MEVAELEGAALDYWVALANDLQPLPHDGHCYVGLDKNEAYAPSINWDQGGPIIERESIGLQPASGKWDAYFDAYNDYDGMSSNPAHAHAYDAPTPLIAAMRAYVAAKFGAVVGVVVEEPN